MATRPKHLLVLYTVLVVHSHTRPSTCCLRLLSAVTAQMSSCDRGWLSDLQTLKYFLSGPLQRRLSDF